MKKFDINVIIVGAGISGLSCAKTLIKAGIKFLILEAGQKLASYKNISH